MLFSTQYDAFANIIALGITLRNWSNACFKTTQNRRHVTNILPKDHLYLTKNATNKDVVYQIYSLQSDHDQIYTILYLYILPIFLHDSMPWEKNSGKNLWQSFLGPNGSFSSMFWGFAGLVFERPFISDEWNLPTKGDEIFHSETWGKWKNGKTPYIDMKLKGWIFKIFKFFVWLVEIMAQKSVKKFDAEVVLILRGGGM